MENLMKRVLLSLSCVFLMSSVFADVNTTKDSNFSAVKKEQKTDDFQLSYAANNGDIEKVKELIAKGCNVNIRDEYNWTPLNSGHKEVAKLLIANGADVNAPNDRGVLPVMLAIIEKNYDIADMLIKKGAENNIYVAAARGDVNGVKDWLKNEPSIVNALASNDGWAALHWAAYLDHPDVIRVFIENGANIDVRSKKLTRVTPLHWAVRMGNIDSAKLLITNGADVNFKVPGGGSLLHFTGSIEMARLLIDNGADVNARATLEVHNMTPLHSIAGEGGLLIVQRVLFSKSGGANAEDFEKLRGDAEKMTAKIAELLITKGADVNAKTDDGSTALILAAQNGNMEMVKLLLQKAADVNIKTNEGKTAYELAKSKGHTAIVRLLEKAGAKE
jgi:ankyrin repeat protein